MKIPILVIFFYCCIFHIEIIAAQNVGIGTNAFSPSAQLDVNSTNRGFLPPRMTCAQRNVIVNPAAGLMIYCIDCANGEMQYYNGSNWINMTIGIGSNSFVNLPSVTIGTQIWGSKNLDVRTYRNGDVIPQVTDPTAWGNLTTGAWCWYNNDSATYASTYGRLYNWFAVNDSRGLAPQGWHVPTNAEWDEMTKYLDASVDTTCNCGSGTTIGVQLKNTIGWINGGNGNNTSGFSGLPGGYRNYLGSFYYFGSYGRFWSSSEYDTTRVWHRGLSSSSSYVFRGYSSNKTTGNSVRVVRN